MPHTVRLDDDVMAELQRRAVPLVDDINSVLRRLLALTPEGHMGEGEGGPGWGEGTGYLLPYLKSGAIEAGTRLTWERPRVGQTFYATVTETGHLKVDGHPRPFKSPSGAARTAAGMRSVDGWTQAWTLPNGDPLGSIRHA